MQQSRHYRLVIAAVEPAKIADAVSDLEASGLSHAELCLAATPGVMEAVRLSQPHGIGPRLLRLLDVEALPVIEPPVVATSGRLMTTLKHDAQTSHSNSRAKPCSCWLDAGSRAAIVDHIARGEVIVVAGPLTAEQLQAGTRVLLRHSNHHVQGHLLVAPAGAVPRG